MSKFERALETIRDVSMTPEQREAQRRSFAYGNAKIENEHITREMIDRAAEAYAARERQGK